MRVIGGPFRREVRRKGIWRWLWGYITSEEFAAHVLQHLREIKAGSQTFESWTREINCFHQNVTDVAS